MHDNNFLYTIANKISGLLPPAGKELKAEVQHSIKLIIQQALAELDCVTREEFNVQAALLEKLHYKIAELEQKVLHLQKK